MESQINYKQPPILRVNRVYLFPSLKARHHEYYRIQIILVEIFCFGFILIVSKNKINKKINLIVKR